MNKNHITHIAAIVAIVIGAGIYSAACITENNYIDGGNGGNGGNGGDGNGGVENPNTSSSTTVSSSTGQPTCIKGTCEQAGANCGEVFDGCGGWLDCGTCDPNEWQYICGSEKFENGISVGAKFNVCGGGCLYKTQDKARINCSEVLDGSLPAYYWCTPLSGGALPVEQYGRCRHVGDSERGDAAGKEFCCERAPSGI